MDTVSIAIEWQHAKPSGYIEVVNGECSGGAVVSGNGTADGAHFHFRDEGPCRICFTLVNGRFAPGPNQTRVTVHNGTHTFSFFARDIRADHPVLVELYGVMVLPASDHRSYAEVAAVVRSRKAQSVQQKIEGEPEETYENACHGNRVERCPTWLGLSRDMRFFEVGQHRDSGYWGYIQPRFHSVLPVIPEAGNKSYMLDFAIGKGSACRHEMTRSLDQGCLPILHATQREDEITYHLTAFATQEISPLRMEHVRGSEWRACYANTGGCMLTAEEREGISGLVLQETVGREEETVLVIRVKAVNSGAVPNYAWFKTPGCRPDAKVAYDSSHGVSSFQTGRAYAISRLNGRPAPAEEMAILLQPNDSATLDILIPHQPLPNSRALEMAGMDIDSRLDECRVFWQSKLRSGATVSVPEDGISARIKAGLLHCDIAALGHEPAGPRARHDRMVRTDRFGKLADHPVFRQHGLACACRTLH